MWHDPTEGGGRARPLCPGTSNIDLLSYRERIIYLDAEIAHSTLDLRMAEKELDGAQVAGAAPFGEVMEGMLTK